MSDWPNFDHKDKCPACGDEVDKLANFTAPERPGVGEPVVCIMCHSVNVLGEDGYLRLSTPGEAMAFTQDAELQWLITTMEQLGPPRRQRGIE